MGHIIYPSQIEIQVVNNSREIDDLDIAARLLVDTIEQMMEENNHKMAKAMMLSADYFSKRLLNLTYINRDILEMVEIEVYRQI